MLDEPVKLNIKTVLDTELIAWVRQVFPIFEEVYRRFCTPNQMSCQECSQKIESDNFNTNKIDMTCLVVEPLLPGIYGRTSHKGKNTGLIVEEYNPNTEKNNMEI